MKPNNEKYGFTPKQWERFKKEAREIMVGIASNRQMITYSDMAAKMTTIAVEAHDQVLWDIIGYVAKDEEKAGRGLLSAVVAHKHGDMEPGKGFFELANPIGETPYPTGSRPLRASNYSAPGMVS